MPLTHDMGLIGFYLMQFANRVHINLMPTELFVRRPLLWLQVAAKKRATITCSPNFGYRHFLKVLGERRPPGLDLSSLRLIYNGADHAHQAEPPPQPSATPANPPRCSRVIFMLGVPLYVPSACAGSGGTPGRG